jgi:rare lipoprotein A (peptidoglycan hydrolase)
MACLLRVLYVVFCGVLWLATDVSGLLAVETMATYYHPSLQGGVMANGERYNRWDPEIAACNWYPLGTLLKVTRRGTDASIYVQIKDRGSSALTLDLTEAGFARLGYLGEGRIPVSIEMATPEVLPAEVDWDPADTAPPSLPLLGAPFLDPDAEAAGLDSLS